MPVCQSPTHDRCSACVPSTAVQTRGACAPIVPFHGTSSACSACVPSVAAQGSACVPITRIWQGSACVPDNADQTRVARMPSVPIYSASLSCSACAPSDSEGAAPVCQSPEYGRCSAGVSDTAVQTRMAGVPGVQIYGAISSCSACVPSMAARVQRQCVRFLRARQCKSDAHGLCDYVPSVPIHGARLVMQRLWAKRGNAFLVMGQAPERQAPHIKHIADTPSGPGCQAGPSAKRA